MPSSFCTRLGIFVPSNFTSGSSTEPPARPKCLTPLSHSAGFSPSPFTGNCWSSSHRSTGRYPVPSRTLVTTLSNRLVDQNDGTCLSLHVAVSHLSSHGTSGQFSFLSDVQV